MNKFYTLLFLLLTVIAGTGTGRGAHVTPAGALARINKTDMQRSRGMNRSASDFRHSATIGGLYVFNSADGFMILPDDDRAPAVLAYSDAGQFVMIDNPAFESWLGFYNRQLKYLKSLPQTESTTARRLSGQRTERTPIEPLIKTEWNQEAPYNLLCPKINGHDVVTGCVATAMAQFMKYYNYPAKGTGTHSYFWQPGNETLSLDYDTIPFQWDKMTLTYDSESSQESKLAVAQLMVACGISVDMHYDIGDSGAATTRMGVSLINIFKYSPSLWMPQRDFYGYDEWVGMIYDELAKGTPVLYSGQGTAGGHQFICDGYQSDDYFHFNWGWGGLSNGYFLLTALNPDDLGVGGGAGGFNTDQIATLSARPAQDGDQPTYVMYNTEAFLPDTTILNPGDELVCSGTYFNFSMAELPTGSSLGMKFVNTATNEAQYVKGPDVGGMHLDDGRYYDIINFPTLADGSYVITPALYAGDKWNEVRMPLGNPDKIMATVSYGTAFLTPQEGAEVTITDIQLPDTVYAGHYFPLSFKAVNPDSLEYYSNVTPYMLNTEGTAVATSNYRPMDVMPLGSEAVNDYVANFTAISGQSFPSGNYQLVFRNEEGMNISNPVNVYVDTIVAPTVISISDFHLVTPTPVKNPEQIEFAFKLRCDSGVYFSCPQVIIFPGDGGYDQGSLSGENHYLTAGQSVDVDITGSLANLKDGWYIAAAYDGDKDLSKYVRFKIDTTVGVTDIINNIDAYADQIYNFQGMKCYPPLKPGYYIIAGKKIFVR